MKSLGVLLCLVAVAVAYQECKAENRDCTCGDRSYKSCLEPGAQVSLHVDDLEECILNCDLFATMNQCDWIIFYNRGPDENCRLIANGETMEEYLNSCNIKGQPVHFQNGNCMSAITLPGDLCTNEDYCPGETCTACDPNEECEKNYHESECTLTENAVLEVEVDNNSFDGCTTNGIIQSKSNDLTYVTWDKMAEKCDGYAKGARNCDIQVIKVGFSIDQVNQCRTG